MNNPRQQLRQRVNGLVDEMIVDLKKIKHHTLTMDEFTVLAVGKGLTHNFNQILTIYRTMNDKILVPDRRIKPPDKLILG